MLTLPIYKSTEETQGALTGEAQTITIRPDFVPKVGPRGKKLLIDRLVLTCEATITVAVTAVDAEDIWRSIGNVKLVQIDGVARVNGVDGDSLRVAMIEKSSCDYIVEHPDLPVAGATVFRFTFPIELAGQMAYDGDDFAMPAELFNGLTFTGMRPNANGLGIAGGTITIGACKWWVIAECREVDYLFVGPTDTVDVAKFGSSSDLITLIGGRIGGLSLRRPGVAGGLALTAITALSIDELMRNQLIIDDLYQLYSRGRGAVAGTAATNPGVYLRNDPHNATVGKAIPLVYARPRQKTITGPFLASVQIRTVSSALTDLIAVKRTINQKNPDNFRFMQQFHKAAELDPNGWTLKTRGSTRKALNQWSDLDAAFLPSKRLVLSMAGR